MKLHAKCLLAAVLALLALSAEGDACWRCRCRRRCTTTVCAPVAVYQDPRLQTDKRDLPEFREPRGGGLEAAESFVEPTGDSFTVRKHHRGKAKTTYAQAPVEEFRDLRALILTLPSDEDMRARTQLNWNFDRIDEDGYSEQRNVRVLAYLFAVQKESDNDFHLILDDDGDIEEGAKMNAEISGIPTEGSDAAAIRSVRDAFKARFNGNPPTQYKDWPYDGRAIPVLIEGSLFFDRDHPSGTVGPQGHRPGSAWEIHPIRSIQFLDN
jgi:hypothetical protein